MTHAFFKALLFLGAGAVIYSMHHALHHTDKDGDAQDMRNMGGLRRFMPVTAATMWIATFAIAGIWPFAGFFSKDEIIWAAGAAAHGPYATFYTAFWVLALATAMLTAFYMTRLMVMTFHGANRTGRAEAEHLQDAPWTMTVPLVILAVLSVFGGWVNVPEGIRESALGLFGGLPMSDWLHHWLEPVTAAAHQIHLEHVGEVAQAAPLIGGGEVVWAAGSGIAALAVVLFTVLAARRWSLAPAVDSREPKGGLGGLMYNKWYVDEIYQTLILRPIVSTSRFLWRVIDQGIIDGLVNTVGLFARAAGWFVSLFQTGALNTYALVLTVGVLVILGMVAL